MSVSVYIEGSKYYYTADDIKYVDVLWNDKEVVLLVQPKECYDNGPHVDVDECVVEGEILIPKDKITHIICWAGNK